MADNKRSPSYYVIVAAVVAVLVWGGWGAAMYWGVGVSPKSSLEQFASLGDSFGVINALFTALAFIGVIWAAVLQREELKAQRQELTQTRDVLNKQSEALAQQAFDSIFFEMLTSFRNVSNEIHLFNRDGPPAVGTYAIKQMSNFLREEIATNHYAGWSQMNDGAVRSQLEAVYLNHCFTPQEMYLGPYYRSLYHVFKLIDKHSGLTQQQKVNYANIARANLSKEALFMLAVNVTTGLGAKFLPLIERYGVLKHMGNEDMRDLFLRFIKKTAFESYEERSAGGKLTPQ